jgi:hypothetical protein
MKTSSDRLEPQPISRERSASALRLIACLGVVSLSADMTYEGAHSIVGPSCGTWAVSAFHVTLIAGAGGLRSRSHRGVYVGVRFGRR